MSAAWEGRLAEGPEDGRGAHGEELPQQDSVGGDITQSTGEVRLYGFASPLATVTPEPIIMLKGWRQILEYSQGAIPMTWEGRLEGVPWCCSLCGWIQDGSTAMDKCVADKYGVHKLVPDYAAMAALVETALGEQAATLENWKRLAQDRHSHEDSVCLSGQRITALETALKEVTENADFLRAMVGECHLMISRNTTEFQLRSEWEATTLPRRFQKALREREGESERLREAGTKAQRLLEGLHRNRDWACRECVSGSDVLIKGFLCGYHDLIAALAAPTSRGERT